MDRNFLITPVVPVERSGKTQGPGTAHAWGKGPSRRREKIFIPQRACTGFRDMFNMPCLSPNDDSQRRKGNRQKTQGGGSRDKSNNGPQQEKQCNCSSLSASNDCLVG